MYLYHNKTLAIGSLFDFFQVVFLQEDRHVEFHTQFGRYYRVRIPSYGRDMAYHKATCDLYFVGARYIKCSYCLSADCWSLINSHTVLNILGSSGK